MARGMVREASAIVVLEILSSRPGRPAEAASQRKDTLATVKVEQVIVGGREHIGEIRVPCFFPCARVRSPPGRYLVFLGNREGLPTSSNWRRSLLPVTGSEVRCYGEDVRSQEDRPLKQAIERILQVREGRETPSR